MRCLALALALMSVPALADTNVMLGCQRGALTPQTTLLEAIASPGAAQYQLVVVNNAGKRWTFIWGNFCDFGTFLKDGVYQVELVGNLPAGTDNPLEVVDFQVIGKDIIVTYQSGSITVSTYPLTALPKP